MSIEDFIGRVEGTVIQRADVGYAAASAPSLHAPVPDVIVQPRSTAGVAEAVRYATQNGLELSVRCGGHGVAPASQADGVLIDLSVMNTVEVLEENLVRIGSGARWGEVAAALSSHGLGLTSGDTASVGVGGLTLGGGFGWMVRTWGLAIDNLTGMELVNANGEVLHVNEKENADLFWALRGGGGNFGVVTSFTFRASPLESVVSGAITFDQAHFATVLKGWRDAMRTAPEALNATVMALPAMGPDMPPTLQIVIVYVGGDEQAANEAIQPLLQIEGIIEHEIKSMPYIEILNTDEMPLDFPFKFVTNNGFATEFTDELIAAVDSMRHQLMPAAACMFRSLGGAFNRVDPVSTAFSWREGEVLALAAAILPKDAPKEAEERVHNLWAPVAAHLRGSYGNFLNSTDERTLTSMYTPETLERLRKVKQQHDPQNVFHQNQNIAPNK